MVGINGSSAMPFVKIINPSSKQKKQAKRQQEQKKKEAWEDVRRCAHWNTISNFKKTDFKHLLIGTHHMHPFAQRVWNEKNNKNKKTQFKTFTIGQDQLEINVSSEAIKKHFQVLELPQQQLLYVPKLNWVPEPVCTTPITRKQRQQRKRKKTSDKCS